MSWENDVRLNSTPYSEELIIALPKTLSESLYNSAWTEQFVKRQKKKRCFAYMKCFIQIKINDIGVFRAAFLNEAT